MSKKIKVVIAGGGTGGHVYPALQIAKGLCENGLDKNDIVFFGSNRTIENDLVPKNGFALVSMPGRGLNKSEYFQNIFNSLLLSYSIFKALAILLRKRPNLVIGVGGYASLPALIAASILRIHRVVHEQNSVVGRTNSLLIKLGAKAITTFETTQGINDPIRLGLPISDRILQSLDLRDRRLKSKKEIKEVVVSGGSLGSVLINKIVVKMVSKYREKIDFKIVHVCGKNNYETTKELYEKANCFEGIALHSYRDDLVDLYATSDCVVSRAGAGTCVELETLGVKSVLIPLKNAPGDHQARNATGLVDSGLGILLREQDLDEDVLFESVTKLLKKDEISLRNDFHLGSKARIAHYLIENFGLVNKSSLRN